jgi:hypothetical protein
LLPRLAFRRGKAVVDRKLDEKDCELCELVHEYPVPIDLAFGRPASVGG